jgi:hypothetical protein
MTTKQQRVLHALSESDVIFVEPDCLVKERTICGVHGDDDDLAISLRWHDSAGCEWEADFSECSLRTAGSNGNRITLKDTSGADIRLLLHKLEPANI